ncbi:MAG: glycosyltransferase family 39 protein [Caldilineaceae bacterium]
MVQTQHTRAARWWPLTIISGLTLVFGLINWHWLRINVVTYGWDRMDHLITSLAYNDILHTITPQSIFSALVYSNYYPPFVHLSVWVLYKLFGVNEDVAVMVNIGYLVVLLAATWLIAERVGGVKTAALAVTLLCLFPMIYAMSRYLYLDFALTAMVALALAFLLETERFTRRGWSNWFGAALGVAFLVKWTAAAFLAAPLLFILWRSGVFSALATERQVLRPNWRRLLLLFGVSVLLMAAWFIPARGALNQSPLGYWLIPAYTLLTTGLLYALFCSTAQKPEPVRRLVHAISAGMVAVWVMALWYLPNSEFITSFLKTAYGLKDGRFWAYGKYLYEVTTEQLGIALSIVFALVVIVFLWQRRTKLNHLFAKLDDTAWVLLLWAVVPYIIFSTRVSLAHDRFLMPFLPPFAIWMAAGLWQWRGAIVRIVAIALVLLIAATQFALISFDSLAPWRHYLLIQSPVGPINLLAHGFFIQYEASEETDPGYAIAPPVLDMVNQARLAQNRERINLGILVNSYQLHEKHFLYEIYTTYPQVDLRELARNWHDQPAYNQLFDMDFVLVNDTHSFRTSEPSQAVVQRILTQPEDLFNRAFRPVRQWTLPDGEQSTLYARRFAPTEPGLAPQDYIELLNQLGGIWGPGDALVLTAPDQAYIMGLSLPEKNTLTLLPLPADGKTSADSLAELTRLAQTHKRIFYLRHNDNKADPTVVIETWLRQQLLPGPDLWINALRVTPFVTQQLPSTANHTMNAQWRQGAALSGVAVNEAAFKPQSALALQLFWQKLSKSPQKISLQLLAPDGKLIAQQDADLATPTAPFVLLLPRIMPAGAYQLLAILYDPKTLQRDQLVNGGDALHLLTFARP